MYKQFIIAALGLAAVPACKSHEAAATAPADNTARNQRDRAQTPTADNAVATSSDLDVTQKIRKDVVGDGTLSTNAHNCKIVVQDGTVTLVGPVANAAESDRILQIASAAAGTRKVVNQLEVTN